MELAKFSLEIIRTPKFEYFCFNDPCHTNLRNIDLLFLNKVNFGIPNSVELLPDNG